MSIDVSSPDRAPARTDLGFLRHRSRRQVAAPSPSAPSPSASSPLAEFLAGQRSRHASSPTRSTAAVPSAPAGQLEPARPSPPPAAPAAPATPATPRRPARAADPLDLSADPLDLSADPLDLSAPLDTSSTSLDLSAPTPPAPPPARPAPSIDRPSRSPTRQEARTRPDVPTILTARSPTVTLTRVQSGVGVLLFEAVVAPSIGDARLGCAYQLRSGRSSTVQHSSGRRTAPPGETRRPIVLAQRQQFERLEVDLRQSQQLERLVVFGFPGNAADIRWAGTLVVTTFGGARVELPITLPPSNAVAVLASMYNVHGELVLR